MSDAPKLSDEEKRVFKDAAWRRKQAGIKLKRFCIMCDENHVHSLNNFWNGWVESLGKMHAADYLLISMKKADEALRSALERKHNAGR